MDPTDADLVRRAAARQRRPFEILVDRYYPRCLRFAWRQLGDQAEAEEAVQDAFLRAYRALGSCTPERFRSWLMSILVNRCRTYAVRAWRRDSRLTPLDDAPPAALGVPPGAEVQSGDGRLASAIAGLSPALREAFLLKHVEGLTYEEIAAMTGAGVSAVKMRVQRAAGVLLRAMGERDG